MTFSITIFENGEWQWLVNEWNKCLEWKYRNKIFENIYKNVFAMQHINKRFLHLYLHNIIWFLPCICLHEYASIVTVFWGPHYTNDFSVILHNAKHFSSCTWGTICEKGHQQRYVIYQFYVRSNFVDTPRQFGLKKYNILGLNMNTRLIKVHSKNLIKRTSNLTRKYQNFLDS